MIRLILVLALCLSGCSTPVVRCDAHLLPINAPSPASSTAGEQSVQRVP
jgi:uncharacterized lipoprotein YmbA